MPRFRVHIERHCGWHTAEAEGATFGDAAIAAVIATCKQFGLDVSTIPHTVTYQEREGYASVVFREASSRSIFGGVTRPGDLWFGERVRQACKDDCGSCGGTGVNFYNPFMQCYRCGDRSLKGKGTGKLPVEAAVPA